MDRSILDSLRSFADRNRDRSPITEAFPHGELRALRRENCDEGTAALLVELAGLAGRYQIVSRSGSTAYEGDHLHNLTGVVEAIGATGQAGDEVLQFLRRTLAAHHRARYPAGVLPDRFATGLPVDLAGPGTQDADQVDRDEAVERAEDLLAEAILHLLAGLGPAAAAAAPEVEQAQDHRSQEVSYRARTLAARLPAGTRTASGTIENGRR